MSNLQLTTGRTPGASSGGTIITTRDHTSQAVIEAGASSVQLAAVDTWYPYEFTWTGNGKRTTTSVVLTAAPDILYSLTGSDAGTTTLTLGKIGNGAVRWYVKATSKRAANNLVQTVSNVVYGTEEVAPAAPIINSLANTSVTSTTAAFSYSVSSPYGAALTVTDCIVARGVTPTTFVSSSASPISKSSLTANTDYDFYLRVTDGTFTTTSSALQFKTLEATSTAPSFSTQPRLKAGSQTSQGFTVEYGVSNPGGYTLTHKLSLDNGSTYTTKTATLNGTSGLWEIAVTGQVTNTSPGYSVGVQVLGDVYTITSSIASIATGTLTISGTLSALVGDTQVTLSGPTVNFTPAKWQRKTGSGSWVDVASTATTFPSTVVTGLTNGQSYTFTVQAVDSAGNESNDLTATQTPDNPQAAAGTHTFRIDDGADDISSAADSSYFYAGDTNWGVGKFSAGDTGYAGCALFRNVQIGRGQTITAATFTMTPKAMVVPGTVVTTINAHDVADGALPANYAGLVAAYAQRTTASIGWSINTTGLTMNAQKVSPDIKTVIQEIVDRSDWVYGNDILIFWGDFAKATSAGMINAYTGADANAAYHPTLSVTV
jgi:hypothetical protein